MWSIAAVNQYNRDFRLGVGIETGDMPDGQSQAVTDWPPLASLRADDLLCVIGDDQANPGQERVELPEDTYCQISCSTRPTDPEGWATPTIAASVGAMSFTAIFW